MGSTRSAACPSMALGADVGLYLEEMLWIRRLGSWSRGMKMEYINIDLLCKLWTVVISAALGFSLRLFFFFFNGCTCLPCQTHGFSGSLRACLKFLEHMLSHSFSLHCHAIHSDRKRGTNIIHSCTGRPWGKSVSILNAEGSPLGSFLQTEDSFIWMKSCILMGTTLLILNEISAWPKQNKVSRWLNS